MKNLKAGLLCLIISMIAFSVKAQRTCQYNLPNQPLFPDTSVHPFVLDQICSDPNLKWYRYKANQDCCGAKQLKNKVNLIASFDPNLLRNYQTDSARLAHDTSSFICGSGLIQNEISQSPNCGTRERQTSWYSFQIAPLGYPGTQTAIGSTAGFLRFKIIPCDIAPNSNCSSSLTSPACNCARTSIKTSYRDDGLNDFGGSVTDYDWGLYKINAFGLDKSAACTAIHSSIDSNGTAKKVSCNYSGSKGNTGMFEPGAQGAFIDPDFLNAGDSRYNRPIKVHVGDRFILAVACFSTTLVGSKIDFSGNGFTTLLTSAQRQNLTIFDSTANIAPIDTILGVIPPVSNMAPAINYPNPFAVSTIIPYTITQNGPVSVRLMNAVGQEAATVNTENETQPGKHELTFYRGSLKAGLYYCQLKMNGRTEYRPMLITD